ncbi:MAG: prepilin peptidase [Clostridiales bacterium]|nr:prepilin peptidase [Clostridiales bacterium]MCF8023049.1 prepilin peptidase [Clostridiales bacterium]
MIINILLLIVIIISLYTDLRSNKIYNKVVMPGVVLALGYHLLNSGLSGLLWSTQGMLLGMGLLIIPFVLGGMGAGDVKLLGFVGACGGPGFVWVAFLATALAGGVLALFVLFKNKQLISRLKTAWYTFLSFLGLAPRVNVLGTIEARDTITFPYGIAITAGTLIAYLVR